MEIKRDAYLQQLIERKDNGMIKVKILYSGCIRHDLGRKADSGVQFFA